MLRFARTHVLHVVRKCHAELARVERIVAQVATRVMQEAQH